jgi:beta-galactosidase beta subunit
MVVDELYNLNNYSNLSRHIKAVSKCFSAIEPTTLTDGRYDIGSSGVYSTSAELVRKIVVKVPVKV